MSGSVVVLPLARIEGQHLLALLDELLLLLDEGRNGQDDALGRLTPRVYPDDDSASTEFASLTRDDLLDRRTRDAQWVRDDLIAFTPEQSSGEGDPLLPHDVVIHREHLDAWLRTLTAMRLIMASRFGIVDAEGHDPEDPRFGVYDWIGYRLEGLIQAADEQDAPS